MWLLAAILAAVGFLLVAQVAASGALEAGEVAVLVWLDSHRTSILDVVALGGAALGSRVAAALALGGAVLLLLRHRWYFHAGVLAATLVVVPGLISGLKIFYGRPRPTLSGEEVRALGYAFAFPASAAFPSGHALIAAGAFGTLAILLLDRSQQPAMRRTIVAGTALLIVLIGFSRLYLAVHYPTDVVAGVLLGSSWAALCGGGLATWRQRRGQRGEPEDQVGAR